jgi:pimeloyl-ACP methyl ester carboxylesterase
MMKNTVYKLMAISLMLIGHPSFADNFSICNQRSISSVFVPVSPNDHGRTFKYKFQIIRKSLTAPTVIVIPGGPGGTSISTEPVPGGFDFQQILLGLDTEYNAIFTDPRSQGCNSDFLFHPNELSTSALVSDLIEMIKGLGLKRYILYGHSYGSVVALQLAHQIEVSAGITRPIAVLLSGAWSKPVSQIERAQWAEIAWQQFQNSLPADLKNYFFGLNLQKIASTPRFLLDISGETWANFIFSGLTEGAVSYQGKVSDNLLFNLRKLNGTQAEKLELIKLLQPQKSTSPIKEIFRQIYCHELGYGAPVCLQSGIKLDRPFDSKNFQVHSPLVYASGSRDPAVNIRNAYYGYSLQKWTSRKYFIEIFGGGHANFMFTRNCLNPFWESVYQGTQGLNQVLKNCDPTIRLRY